MPSAPRNSPAWAPARLADAGRQQRRAPPPRAGQLRSPGRRRAPGPHRYVVMITVGYRTDAVALRQSLSRHYAYLGATGSAAKVAELRQVLQEEGFSAGALAGLRGPIGVPAGRRLPKEIAVSVAAELIAVRNARAAAGQPGRYGFSPPASASPPLMEPSTLPPWK